MGLDERTAEAVRLRLYDSLAAVEIGRHIADVAALRGGDDPASIVRFATAAARATEADDIYVPACATIGGVVAPAAVLAAGDADDLLAAVAAGYDAMAKLALGIDGARVVYGDVWTTLVCAPVGVAAAVARALRLDGRETASALALASSCSVTAAPERWRGIGDAAAAGFLAAHEAGAGATSSFRFPLAVRDVALERPAVLDVDTKAFPCARQTLPAVLAALEVAPDPNERIAVGVPAQVLAMVDRSGSPADRLDSIVDLRYRVALALSRPDALFDARRDPLPRLPVRPVNVAADDELTGLFPALGGRVTAGDRTAVVYAPAAFGWAELEAKWRRIAAASGVPARLDELRRGAEAAEPGLLRPLLVDAP